VVLLEPVPHDVAVLVDVCGQLLVSLVRVLVVLLGLDTVGEDLVVVVELILLLSEDHEGLPLGRLENIRVPCLAHELLHLERVEPVGLPSLLGLINGLLLSGLCLFGSLGLGPRHPHRHLLGRRGLLLRPPLRGHPWKGVRKLLEAPPRAVPEHLLVGHFLEALAVGRYAVLQIIVRVDALVAPAVDLSPVRQLGRGLVVHLSVPVLLSDDGGSNSVDADS